jgi:hypothetical protein
LCCGSSLTTSSLYTLTRDVHTRFPLEIRDIIYGHLLTEEDIQDLADCSRTHQDVFSYPHIEPHALVFGRGSKPGLRHIIKTPDGLREVGPEQQFMDPNLTYAPFATELVDILYEVYRDFWIDTPSHIATFMNTAFISMGRRSRDARLSTLYISGFFDENEPETLRLSTLATDMQALSDCVWAPEFYLGIEFRTELGFSYYNEQALRSLPRRFHATWQVLRPWITQAEARGATVKLIFFTQAKEYQYPDGENNMLNTEAEWEKELTDLLRPYGHTFVPLHIPSRWQTFGNSCCRMLGWCWEKLPKCV